MTAFTFAQRCPGTLEQWQIGLASLDPTPLMKELFFTVIRREGAFSVSRIDTVRPAGCPGHASPSEVVKKR
jgi:hypothetical protein